MSKIANVIVPVNDQDAALRFYTEKLGLETRVDVPFGDGNRWIEVAPAGAVTTIALAPPAPGATAGGRETGITLVTIDVDAFHAQLAERGVDVDAEVSHFGDPVPQCSGSATSKRTSCSPSRAPTRAELLVSLNFARRSRS